MSGNPFQPLVVFAVAGMVAVPVMLIASVVYLVRWLASGGVHWPTVAVTATACFAVGALVAGARALR